MEGYIFVGEAYKEARGMSLDEEEAYLRNFWEVDLGEEDGKREL